MSTASAPFVETHGYKARKAFSDFWIAGTAGAFLSGLARTIPLDLDPTIRHQSPQGGSFVSGSVHALRYGYAAWLLVYFFLSTFSLRQRKPSANHQNDVIDIFFDLLQSGAALTALFYLGFVNRGIADGNDPITGFRFANGAILLICSVAWLLFSAWPDGQQWPGLLSVTRINFLRWCGVVLSAAGLYLSYRPGLSPDDLEAWLEFLLALLTVVLLFFGVMVWTQGRDYLDGPLWNFRK